MITTAGSGGEAGGPKRRELELGAHCDILAISLVNVVVSRAWVCGLVEDGDGLAVLPPVADRESLFGRGLEA